MDEVALRTLDALLNSLITINSDIDEPLPDAFIDHAQEIVRAAQQYRQRQAAPAPLQFGRRAALLALEYFKSGDQRANRSQAERRAIEQLLCLSYRIQHCSPDALQAAPSSLMFSTC